MLFFIPNSMTKIQKKIQFPQQTDSEINHAIPPFKVKWNDRPKSVIDWKMQSIKISSERQYLMT